MAGATSTSDLLFRVKPRWTTTIGSGGVADGSTTTIPLASASGLNDGEAYIAVINRVDANGEKQDTWETFKGVLSGTNMTSCVRGVEGTAQAWSAGTVVEILMTAEHWNKMVEWAEKEHNQDGTHDDTKVAMLAGNQEFTGDKTFSGAVKIDTISEKTTDAGVTTDGVKHKDSEVYTDQINEKTTDAGVTVDGVKHKDKFTEFEEISAPSTPASNKVRLYAKDKSGVSTLYYKKDDGTEVEITSGGVSDTDVKARVYKGSSQAINNATETLVTFSDESYDVGNDFDLTNNKFVVPTTGYYLIAAKLAWRTVIDGKVYEMRIKKGDTIILYDKVVPGAGGEILIYNKVADIVYLSAGDEIKMYAYHNDGTNNPTIWYTVPHTHLAIHLISV